MDQSKINRRDFLGTMGAAATGLALAAKSPVTAQAAITAASLQGLSEVI
jgi:hypothetical protein